MVRGKSEAKFSIVRKMSQNNAEKRYKIHDRQSLQENIQIGIKRLLDIEISKTRDLTKVEEIFTKAEIQAKMIKGGLSQRKGLN